jgi:hypothetical protein
MKKLYEKNHGWDLYCALILEKGDKVKRHWLDCVISMDSIRDYRAEGVDSFVAILRETGAELLPVGIEKEHGLTVVRHYAFVSPDSLVYLLNYKEGTIWGLETWGEAETIIEQGF